MSGTLCNSVKKQDYISLSLTIGKTPNGFKIGYSSIHSRF